MKKKITFIALFYFAILNIFAQSDSLNIYHHPVLGFTIKYSKDWNPINIDDHYANLKNIKLNDEEFNKLLIKNASIPFFAISKFKEPYEDLNPSLKINTRPYGNLQGQPLEVIIKLLIGQFEKIFLDFKIQQEPIATILNENKAVYAKFFYTMKSQDGTEYKTCSEIWLIDKGQYFYLIGAGTKQDESNCKREEILGFLNTIELK